MAKQVRLVRAALTLGLSYSQVQRLVCTRRLRGGKDEDGKWFVDAEDLLRYEQEVSSRGTGAPQPAEAAAHA